MASSSRTTTHHFHISDRISTLRLPLDRRRFSLMERTHVPDSGHNVRPPECIWACLPSRRPFLLDAKIPGLIPPPFPPATTLAMPTMDLITTLQTNSDLCLALVSFVVLYHVLAPYYSTSKKRAWIATALGSGFMTVASIPYVYVLVCERGDIRGLRTDPSWSTTVNRVFQAYLISDLAMGAIYYRQHVSLIMGWIHHVAYFVLVQFLIQRSWSHIFCLCAFMELPTFLLAIATLHPQLRHDILFATTFFCTRLAFHFFLFVSYLVPSRRNVAVKGSFLPSVFLAAAFPMHVVWFSGCIKGFLRRAHQRRLEAAESVSRSSTAVVLEKTAAQSPAAPNISLPPVEIVPPLPGAHSSIMTSAPLPLRVQALLPSTSLALYGIPDKSRILYDRPPTRPRTRGEAIKRALNASHRGKDIGLEMEDGVRLGRRIGRMREVEVAS